jgi:5-methylcytosine-specific restriction protein A
VKLTTLKPRLATLVTQRIPSQAGTERLRGSAAVKRRARWLELHPLCVECQKDGRVTAATVPDHVVPLWKGGPDTEANLQSLCKEHHDEKSAQEAAERAAGGWSGRP